jgi:hypothetical protein
MDITQITNIQTFDFGHQVTPLIYFCFVMDADSREIIVNRCFIKHKFKSRDIIKYLQPLIKSSWALKKGFNL